MRVEVLLKLKENPLYTKYIRENSNWYKILNRNPNLVDDMIKEMKEKYKLRFSDKVENVSNMASLVTNFINIINE